MPAYKDDKNGTWYVQFYYKDWQGVRRKKYKRGFARKKDAQDWEHEFKLKATESCDMTFSSLVELYFKDMSSRLRDTTIASKRNIFDTKLLPFFGNLELVEISPSHVRKWQSDMMKCDFSPTYLKAINNQLSTVMNYAVKYYGLGKNPVHIAGSMGKKKADTMDFWTLEEFKKFIAAVDKPAMKLAFEVMFWTGLRVGETLALFPQDITDDMMINVCKTTARKDGIDHFYDPKTNKSMRKVPIPEFLYDEIFDYLGKLYNPKDDEQIFYFSKSALNQNLDTYAALAGVKRIRVHDLRHSHASLLIEMNQPILLISDRLGHESVDTTWSTYAHLYPHKGKELAKALEKMNL